MTSGLYFGAPIVLVLVVISALIAAGETALTRISHARAEALVSDGLPGSDALLRLLDSRESTLAPLLLLRIICHLAVASIVAVLVIDRTGTAWIALAEALDQDRVTDGDLILFVGFGAGMSAASAVVRWSPHATTNSGDTT